MDRRDNKTIFIYTLLRSSNVDSNWQNSNDIHDWERGGEQKYVEANMPNVHTEISDLSIMFAI